MRVSRPSFRLSIIDRRRFAPILLAVFAVCVLPGCQQESGPIAQEQTRLSWLGSMYGRYIGAHQGQPPQSVADLRKFVEPRTNAEQLKRLNVASVAALFVSPRDGKPFEMVTYKKIPPPAGGEPPPIVLYEAVGQNGERAVAFLGGNTQVVSEAELSSMLPPKAR